MVERTTVQESAAAQDSSLQEIYIGFEKNDTAPRTGRKGRVIKDDPTKYPGKEDLGPLLGATGMLQRLSPQSLPAVHQPQH